MEKIENNLIEIWNKIKEKTIIKIKDIDEIEKVFGKCFIKIQRQRENLEKSRDMWKDKFQGK